MLTFLILVVLIIIVIILLANNGYLTGFMNMFKSGRGEMFGGLDMGSGLDDYIEGGNDQIEDNQTENDQIEGGEDVTGYFYRRGTNEQKETLKDLKVTGSAVVKNAIIEGPLDVNGYLDIRNCDVKGATKGSGSIVAVGTTFHKPIDFDGYLELYRSTAGKIKHCGKIKGNLSTIDEIEIKDKCSTDSTQPPYITFKKMNNDPKIKLPKGVDESAVKKL